MLKLQAESRKSGEKATEGKIAAVVYGPKLTSTPIFVVYNDFIKVWKEAGESTVVNLAGLGEEHEVLIHDLELDPIKDTVRHIDFYAIEKGKKVNVSVPLEFIGVAPAAKTLGGTLIKVLHEIEIEAMPKDLPHYIKVDVSSLVDFESQIKVSDLVLPTGVKTITDFDEIIALVNEAKEEGDSTTGPDMQTIEVSVKKGKKEEVA